MLSEKLQELKDTLFGAVFPIECIYCGKEGEWICDNCFLFLEFKSDHNCVNCNKPATPAGLCRRCRGFYHLDGVIVAGDYGEEKMKKAVKLLKYRFIKGLAPYLGDHLTSFLKEHKRGLFLSDKNTLVVPIPLHWRRRNWRGFNQAEMIAERMAENLGLARDNSLKRTRYKKPQTRLKKRERCENIKNSFVWKGGNLAGKNIILVDDVVTTGSTMNEAARALKQKGAKRVLGAAVAGEQ